MGQNNFAPAIIRIVKKLKSAFTAKAKYNLTLWYLFDNLIGLLTKANSLMPRAVLISCAGGNQQVTPQRG